MTTLALRYLAAGAIIGATAVIFAALGYWYGRDRARSAAALDQLIRDAKAERRREREQDAWRAMGDVVRGMKRPERGPFARGEGGAA